MDIVLLVVDVAGDFKALTFLKRIHRQPHHLKRNVVKKSASLCRHRITCVSIWELVGDSFNSPFDMIDAPS